MSSKTQTWWDSDYPNCSIRNYHSMPIFEAFCKSKCPSAEELPSGRRTCWEIDNCTIYEWFGADDGEKFGHDLNSDTWFYEHWFLESTTRTVVKSWLRRPFEWGTIIKYFADQEEHVNWNIGDPDKTLEKYTETPDGREGTVSGTRDSPDGPEDFLETFKEDQNKKTRQGKWNRGKAVGKYTREETQDYKAGTDNIQEPGKSLHQKWKVTENTRNLVSKGKEGDLVWNEVVDVAPGRRFEEKVWTRGTHSWGYAKQNTPTNSWKTKWTGKKPEGSFEAARDNARLFEVYKKVKAGVLESFKTLEFMGTAAKEKLTKLQETFDRLNDPDENDYEAILAKIEDMNDFNARLEVLKRDSPAPVSSKALFALVNSNDKIASGLLNMLDAENSKALRQDRANLSSRLKENSDSQELMYGLNQYANILKETVGKLGGEGSLIHDTLIQATLTLESAFKELLDLLETSHNTIDYIAKNFCVKDSYYQILREKHLERLESVRQAFADKERADTFLEKALGLLKDFAHFKKELLSTNRLAEMLVMSQASSEALAKALHITDIPELRNFPTENNMKSLDKRIRLNLILISKLLGLECKADTDFQSLINRLRPAKPFTSFDPTDLLREFWIAGKADQDATQAALAALSLAESDKTAANELRQTALDAVTGHTPTDSQDGLDMLMSSLKTYMQARISQSQLIADVAGREEIIVISSPAKRTASPPKKSTKVRSGKMVPQAKAAIDITEKVSKALIESLDTFTELSNAFEDTSKLEEFSKFVSQVTESFKIEGTTQTSIEDFFNLILDLETEKKAMLEGSETSRSIRTLPGTVEQLIQGTGQKIPEDLQGQKERFEGQSLGNSSKRTTVLLKALARILHLELDYIEHAETTKAPTLVSLTFDPQSAVDMLRRIKDNDIAVAEFLAKLVGSDENLGEINSFKEELAAVLDSENKNTSQALAIMTEYFENSGALVEDLKAFNKHLLNKVLNCLNYPEPFEDDFNALQEILGKNNIIMNAISKQKTPEIEGLEKQSQIVPADSAKILPHLLKIVLEQVNLILNLLKTDALPKEFYRDLEKKKYAAPVRALRPLSPFFRGPHTDDFIEILLKLEALLKMPPELAEKLPHMHADEINSLCKELINKLTENAGIDTQGLSDKTEEVLDARRDSRLITAVSWKDIFSAKGIDIDLEFISELIESEQAFAAKVIPALCLHIGTPEMQAQANSLAKKAEEIGQEEAQKKVNAYFTLRNEQSKLEANVVNLLSTLVSQLKALEVERTNATKALLNEVKMHSPTEDLSQQLETRQTENSLEIVEQIMEKLVLDKKLGQLRQGLKTNEDQIFTALRHLQEQQRIHMEESYKTLELMATELTPKNTIDLAPFKALVTSQSESSSVNELIAGLSMSVENGPSLENQKRALLDKSVMKPLLENLIGFLSSEAASEDKESDLAIKGLFRLVDSPEDRESAQKLKQAKEVAPTQTEGLWNTVAELERLLNSLMPAITQQSALINRLVNKTGQLREGTDTINHDTSSILDRSIRELADEEMMNALRLEASELEDSTTNMPDAIDNTLKRLGIWEKVERHRKNRRDQISKENNRLKIELADKTNQLEDLKSTGAAQRGKMEAHMKQLEKEAEKNSSLIEKLSEEALQKEQNLNSQKTQLDTANELTKNLQEQLQQKSDELDTQGRELFVITREFNEKTDKEAQLTSELEYYRKLSEESFAGDKQKNELLSSLQGELSKLKDSLAEKQDIVDSLDSSLENTRKENAELETDKKELTEQLADLKRQLEESKGKYQSSIDQLTGELKDKDKEHQEEVKKLEHFIEDKQTAFDEQEEAIRNLSRYQSLYTSLKEEFGDLEQSQSALKVDLSVASKKRDELSEEVEQLRYKTRSLEKLEKDLQSSQTENQKLKHKIDYLEQYSSESLQDLVNKSNEEMGLKNEELSKLDAELQAERKRLEDLKAYHNKCINRNFLIRLCAALKKQVDDSFIRWRGLKKKDLIDRRSSILTPAIVEPTQEEIEGVEQEDIAYALETVNLANQAMIDNNIILVTYRTANITNEKPLSYINIFKFLEEVMDKKFETDKRDITDRRQPRSMSEFLMEHLQRSFGIPKLAMKFLGQFIPALQTLYEEDNQYAVFYCRLLHLFHPDPVSYNMGIYLVKIRMEFHTIIDKFERFRQGFGQRTSISKGKTYGRAAYEAAGTGGLALISDVIDLIYSIFAEHKKLGALALSLLKPPEVSLENYVLYMICHKMAHLGKTPEGIFNLLDNDGGGSISTSEFIQGINGALDLWIQKDTLIFFFQAISKSEEIQKEDFLKKVSMKFLMRCNKDDAYVITKSAFLTALIDVFKHIQMQDFALLNNRFGSKKTYNFDEFSAAILELDKTIYHDRVVQLFHEAIEACGGTDMVSKDSLVKKIIEYGVGGCGLRAFSIRELLDVLSERKMATKSISEDEDRKIVAATVKRTVVKRTISRK